MKLTKTINRMAVIGLSSLLLGTGLVQAGDIVVTHDSDYLARWQSTYNSLRDSTPKWSKQGVEAFKKSMDAGVPMVMLDVRAAKEWGEKGIIKNALLITLNELPTPVNLARLPEDRNAVIGVYCSGGHRSALALPLLRQLGYKNIISMEGGMDAWVKAGYPVSKISPLPPTRPEVPVLKG